MNKLDELVSQYGEKHTVELAINKECKAMSSQIKDIMTEQKLDTYTSNGYTVTKSVTETPYMNEEALLKVLRDDWTIRMGSMECPYIKTKYYVDMEELESALYKGDISKEVILEMDKCKTVTKTVKLNLKKAKKEEK